MSLKHNGIDILLLYSQSDHEKWNRFLTECVQTLNINRLAQTLRELQVGMAELAKQKLNTPEIDLQFARWTKSIDNTARQIIRIKHPLPQDNPLIAKDKEFIDQLEIKRARDREMEAFFRKASY
jgi:hypothetical protein